MYINFPEAFLLIDSNYKNNTVISFFSFQNSIYFPDGFYELWGGQKMPGDVVIDYAVVETDLPLFIRSGCIIPLHESESSNLLSTRLEPIYFIIALRCNSRECRAIGSLNINRDLIFDFEANEVEV